MAKGSKPVPGPGNPAGPKVDDGALPTDGTPVPAGEKPPENLEEYAITSFEAGALRAAQDNRNRAANEAQAAQVQFADMVEEIVDGLNKRLGTKYKVEDVRQINVKKGFLRIASGKKDDKAKK